jgi:hypothetical protein
VISCLLTGRYRLINHSTASRGVFEGDSWGETVEVFLHSLGQKRPLDIGLFVFYYPSYFQNNRSKRRPRPVGLTPGVDGRIVDNKDWYRIAGLFNDVRQQSLVAIHRSVADLVATLKFQAIQFSRLLASQTDTPTPPGWIARGASNLSTSGSLAINQSALRERVATDSRL